MIWRFKPVLSCENIFNKRYEISRQLYNAVLSQAYKRYKSMIETKKI